MKKISDSNNINEFEFLNDEDYDFDLTNSNNLKDTKIANNIQTKKYDKIHEEDNEIEENKNKNFIINNEIQEENDIITETNVSEEFKKIVDNKEEIDKPEA